MRLRRATGNDTSQLVTPRLLASPQKWSRGPGLPRVPWQQHKRRLLQGRHPPLPLAMACWVPAYTEQGASSGLARTCTTPALHVAAVGQLHPSASSHGLLGTCIHRERALKWAGQSGTTSALHVAAVGVLHPFASRQGLGGCLHTQGLEPQVWPKLDNTRTPSGCCRAVDIAAGTCHRR